MHNKRKHRRIPLISIARLTRRGLQSMSEVLVRDICTHGIGIYTQEAYEKGDLVLIHLVLATDHHETIAESIMGEVVWVAPLSDGTHYAVGIRFDRMEEERPNLYAHIKHLEGIS